MPFRGGGDNGGGCNGTDVNGADRADHRGHRPQSAAGVTFAAMTAPEIRLTPSTARALRCRAQLLAPAEAAETPVAAVRHMLALQAQNANAARWAVGARVRGATRSAVDAALAEGMIIRTWPMRGTHHLIAAEDVNWLTRLCAGRARVGVEKRREQLGLTLDDVLRSGAIIAENTMEPGLLPEEVAEGAVALPSESNRPEGAVALTRDGVRELLRGAGIDADGNRGTHMMRFLCEERILVQGPPQGTRETFTAYEAWVPGDGDTAARDTGPEGDGALRELVVRHVTGHGPATVADVAWWSGLTMTEVRRGLAAAGDALVHVDVEGTGHLMAAEALEAPVGAARPPRNARLLAAFDEYLMGYKDRGLVLDPAHGVSVGPGKGGMVAPTVLAGGRIVGTWSERKRAAGPAVDVAELAETPDGPPGIGKAVDEYRAFAVG